MSSRQLQRSAPNPAMQQRNWWELNPYADPEWVKRQREREERTMVNKQNIESGLLKVQEASLPADD